MGFNTWAAWQGRKEKAAVARDFAMLENEVEPVLKALAKGLRAATDRQEKTERLYEVAAFGGYTVIK